MASVMSGVTLGSRHVFFSFCIDFFVDSVPRNSFTTVEPRYCAILEQKEDLMSLELRLPRARDYSYHSYDRVWLVRCVWKWWFNLTLYLLLTNERLIVSSAWIRRFIKLKIIIWTLRAIIFTKWTNFSNISLNFLVWQNIRQNVQTKDVLYIFFGELVCFPH